MAYQHIKVPEGEKITIANGVLTVPNHPIVPFIEGDGTGRDIWRASVRVIDAAVAKGYFTKEQAAWMIDRSINRGGYGPGNHPYFGTVPTK